jgi:uncharacterized protein YbgA (DUF1722 family)/uncharacterized protein YbbK (DUF523 family)
LEERIKIGISTCLLGENVRYDGGHKHDRYVTDTLGSYLDFVPVCPEVESGLPVPREAMRLVGDPETPRLVTIRTRVDHTDRMLSWAGKRLRSLAREDLCGFIFKGGSPSSGMERVKVYDANGVPAKKGRGIFARAFMERFPRIPVEEDGRLHDPGLRENFIERIFTLKRWRELLREGRTVGNLVAFHTKNKLLCLAHSEKHYRAMGKLVAGGKALPPDRLFSEYERLLMEALALRSTTRKNTNVLQHMMGYFKRDLTPDEKQELLEVIDAYRLELVPLIVPVTLVKHYVRKYDQSYLARQTYLNPHPLALRLRNHV